MLTKFTFTLLLVSIFLSTTAFATVEMDGVWWKEYVKESPKGKWREEPQGLIGGPDLCSYSQTSTRLVHAYKLVEIIPTSEAVQRSERGLPSKKSQVRIIKINGNCDWNYWKRK